MRLEEITAPTNEELAKASGIAKTAAKNWPQYCRACRTRFKSISAILRENFPGNVAGKRVLDWGSAIGGVSIILNDECNVDITAADVDEHSIAWIKKNCQDIKAQSLTPSEALPFDDGAFHAIFGISVFTHIPPGLQEFYLEELHRIAKPDGIVILTVKSDKAVENAKNSNKDPEIHPHSVDELNRSGIIYSSYPDKVLNKMDFAKKADYGITYHSRSYIEELFGKHFEFLPSEQDVIGKQDILVLAPKK